MSARFEGSTVLVAGGTGGLGRAVTSAFLEEGANVVVTYRNQPEWERFKNSASANASRLQGHEVDVTDEAAVNQLIEKVLLKQGRLDAMVNTVGGYAGGLKLWEMETKVFDRMLNLNLRSGYALSRSAVRVMLKQGRGAIVNVASKAADRKSTRLNSSHTVISYAVFCLKKKINKIYCRRNNSEKLLS